jgi:DNA (cytosine-5)-methyltransferase 1
MWKNIANNNIISLFCGVGGIDYPFVREGFTISFANDFNSDAVKIYNSNFKDKAILGDITKIAIDLLPNANGVIAGFPCQAFSIAGNRRGFNDTRGTLFFNVLKILDNKKPEFFLLENVKNLVSHDNGNTFRIIIESLQGIGYFVKYKVLNTCEYGNIPQNRERIYIVGFKNKMNAQKFNFPNPIELNKKISDIIDFKNKVPDKYYYTEIRYPRIYAELSKFNLKKDTVYQ